MNQQDILALIRQEIHADRVVAQYYVSEVPFHVHNGLDSPKLQFLGLSDVPSSYEGSAGYVVVVNANETGLEFSSSAGGSPGGSNGQLQYNDNGSFGGAIIDYISAPTTLKVEDQVGSGVDGVTLLFEGSNSGTGGSALGGGFEFRAGNALTQGKGGDIQFFAGNGAGTAAGGDVVLQPGLGGLTGTRGLIQMRQTSGISYRAIGSQATTDGSFTNVPDSFTRSISTAGLVHARVVGYRTGGAAGSANDSIMTEIVQGAKFVSGTASLVGSLEYLFFYQDNAATDVQFAVSGGSVLLQVKGDTNNNYTWQYEFWYQSAV